MQYHGKLFGLVGSGRRKKYFDTGVSSADVDRLNAVVDKIDLLVQKHKFLGTVNPETTIGRIGQAIFEYRNPSVPAAGREPEFGYTEPKRTTAECPDPEFADHHMHRVGVFAVKYDEDGLPGYICEQRCVRCGRVFGRTFHPSKMIYGRGPDKEMGKNGL
jgi:hypothetical protein